MSNIGFFSRQSVEVTRHNKESTADQFVTAKDILVTLDYARRAAAILTEITEDILPSYRWEIYTSGIGFGIRPTNKENLFSQREKKFDAIDFAEMLLAARASKSFPYEWQLRFDGHKIAMHPIDDRDRVLIDSSVFSALDKAFTSSGNFFDFSFSAPPPPKLSASISLSILLGKDKYEPMVCGFYYTDVNKSKRALAWLLVCKERIKGDFVNYHKGKSFMANMPSTITKWRIWRAIKALLDGDNLLDATAAALPVPKRGAGYLATLRKRLLLGR